MFGFQPVPPGGSVSAPVCTPITISPFLSDFLLEINNYWSYDLNGFLTAGTDPKTWSVSNLPTGLSYNSSTGVISGTPTAAGGWNVIFYVSNACTDPAVGASFNMAVS